MTTTESGRPKNPVLTASAAHAALYSYGAVPDPEVALAAKRRVRATQLEHAVRKHLAGEPELTTQQRQHIAAILLGSA